MSRPGFKGLKVRSFSPAWVIIITALFTAALVLWFRTRTGPSLSELEALIAAGAPFDHVHTVAAAPGGTTYVGAHSGVLVRTGSGKWQRLPGVEADPLALAPVGDQLYLVAAGSGLQRYANGQTELLLQGEIQALAADPQNPARLLAYVAGEGLLESRDGGKEWAKLSDLGGTIVYTLAIHPQESNQVLAGGEQGLLAASADGGRTWSFPGGLQGSVSALAFDPRTPSRLWAAVNGTLLFSENGGSSWRPGSVEPARDRMVTSLSFPPDGRGGLTGVTADGFLFSLTN